MRHDAMGLDIEEPDVLELDSIVPDKEPDEEPDAMESNTGPKVLCHNLLVWVLFSWPCSLSFEKGALGSDMPT
jgi:hypothetical protein